MELRSEERDGGFEAEERERRGREREREMGVAELWERWLRVFIVRERERERGFEGLRLKRS